MSAPTVDLARMTPRARAIWFEAFELGYLAGHAAASADVESAFWSGAELQRQAEDVARGIAEWASHPPLDVLLDRRGEHDRAAAVRAEHRRRGITGPREVAA